MKYLIEKELQNPVRDENGYAEIPPVLYHLYKVDDSGTKTLIKTVENDIKEAARELERAADWNLLELAYKENPKSFRSVVSYRNTHD